MSKKKQSALMLHLTNVKNDAAANGNEVNTVTLYVENEGIPVDNLRIVFNVDGSAVFLNSKTGVYVTNSDSNGLITLDFINTVVEKVTLSCFPVVQPENVVDTEFEFIAEREIFKIDRVQTKNQTLYYGEPTIIWDDASIHLITSGGSGDVEWSLEENSKNDIQLKSDGYGSAEVIAISPFIGSRTIIAKDKITGESANHMFNIHNYISISPEKIGLLEILQDEDKLLLPKEILKSLYDQWGNLSSYNGWIPDQFYWSSEYNLAVNKATTFNSSTGIFVEDSITDHEAEIKMGLVYSKKM